MQERASTWRAWLALVAFSLALLAGAFLHPVQEREFHACDAPTGHVERDPGPDHEHGAHACALCHLAQTVASATPALPPARPGPAELALAAPLAAPGAVPAVAPARRLACRGPPAA